jgi:regulator of RNase E activity RraB
LIQQEGEIDRYAERNSLPPEWAERQKAVARSATYRDVLERMLVDGNDAQAKAYEKSVNKHILPEDVAILEKVRKEDKIRREARDAEYERGLYIILADSAVPTEGKLKALDKAFRRGDMKVPLYEKAKGWVLDINDDPTIPIDKKVDVNSDLTRQFLELEGTDVTASGSPAAPAEGNDIKAISKFRENVAKNRKYLTPEQERNFQIYTEKDFDEARAPKKNLFKSLTDILPLIPNLNPMSSLSITQKAMEIFNKDMSVQQASQEIEKLKTAAVVSGNPNRSRYVVGQRVTNPQGIDLEVVGYDDTGNPRFKVLK